MKFALLMLLSAVAAVKLDALQEDETELAEVDEEEEGDTFDLAELLEDELAEEDEDEDEEKCGKKCRAHRAAKHIMKMFDRNGDGKITRKEMHKTMKKLAKKHHMKYGKKMRNKMNKHFSEADANHNGKVNIKELKAAILKHMKTRK